MLLDLFQQRGKQVMAWADIMVRYPDIVAELPPGLIAVAWYYSADPERQRIQTLAGTSGGKVGATFCSAGCDQLEPDCPRLRYEF